MQVGEEAALVVPPSLGYGKRGAPPEIPGDATLHFTVVLNRIL
jgi:FKBP-type peptidyl-prolyl cis-trans isomerase